MQLSVIIVNYNVKYFLEQCLVSVINACKNLQAEILVIDNCSTDNSKSFFKHRFKEVTFIWNTENAGFSTANNLALQQAKGDIILFLNPDTLLPEDCLEKCLQFYTAQPVIGALGIHMIDGSGQFLKESKRGFPSPATSFFKMVGLAAIFPQSKLFARYYLGHLPENKTSEVDVLSGAFMMVSKKILAITGGFDEAFFMYGEDIDLSYRIEKAGFPNFYFADSSIIHFKGESTKKQSNRYLKVFYGAMELFVKKHYPAITAYTFTALIKIVVILKQLIASIKYRFTKTNKAASVPETVVNTVIVADEKDYAIVVATLKSTDTKQSIIGRICTGQPTATAIDTIEKIPALLHQLAINHIIFCGNGKDLKSNIELMRLLPPTVSYSFHLTGTSSIMGSNDKNKAGYCVAI